VYRRFTWRYTRVERAGAFHCRLQLCGDGAELLARGRDPEAEVLELPLEGGDVFLQIRLDAAPLGELGAEPAVPL
jgi:hypothetical protein